MNNTALRTGWGFHAFKKETEPERCHSKTQQEMNVENMRAMLPLSYLLFYYYISNTVQFLGYK